MFIFSKFGSRESHTTPKLTHKHCAPINYVQWMLVIKHTKTYHDLRPLLTHWGRDKMAAIFQTIFSNAFSWMKMYEFRLKFHWSLFLRVQLTISQYWFRYNQYSPVGSKPLSEPMMVSLPTHICVTRPQWVNAYCFSLLHAKGINSTRVGNCYSQYVAIWCLLLLLSKHICISVITCLKIWWYLKH